MMRHRARGIPPRHVSIALDCQDHLDDAHRLLVPDPSLGPIRRSAPRS
jgi:hypothetical protein